MLLTLFPNITKIKDRTRRRTFMVLVTPLVLIEYVWNAFVGFGLDYRACWNIDLSNAD